MRQHNEKIQDFDSQKASVVFFSNILTNTPPQKKCGFKGGGGFGGGGKANRHGGMHLFYKALSTHFNILW